jgi:hypothetical protein
MELYDSSVISVPEYYYPAHLVAFSDSDTDDEVITTTVTSSGADFISVYRFGGSNGNTCDLDWTSSP